jgi:hypothetical protein
MRIPTITVALLQVALLAACDGATTLDESAGDTVPTRASAVPEAKQSADAIAVGAVGRRDGAAGPPSDAGGDQWLRSTTSEPMDRLIRRRPRLRPLLATKLQSASGQLSIPHPG